MQWLVELACLLACWHVQNDDSVWLKNDDSVWLKKNDDSVWWLRYDWKWWLGMKMMIRYENDDERDYEMMMSVTTKWLFTMKWWWAWLRESVTGNLVNQFMHLVSYTVSYTVHWCLRILIIVSYLHRMIQPKKKYLHGSTRPWIRVGVVTTASSDFVLN